MQINGIDIRIQKDFYNKSKVTEDGITHTIDTSIDYPLFHLVMTKSYFDANSKEEVINQVISDLGEVVAKLKELREKKTDKGDR